MALTSHQSLIFHFAGKRFPITAIFHDVNEANDYLEKHQDEGVIISIGPYIFIANLYSGEKE